MKKIAVQRIELLKVELPFKRSFKHALHTRQSSGSVFVKVYLEDGTTGYGEALPRKYVTGETADSVLRTLSRVLPRKVVGTKFSGLKNGAEFMRRLKALDGAARCALEIGLFDALGKYFHQSLSTLMGKPAKKTLFPSGIISGDALPFVIKQAWAIKVFGFKAVKIKAGQGNDLMRLKAVRKILGDKVDIRVDANCAWDADEAIEKIEEMRKCGISAVEQPVARHNIRGLKKVTDSVSETIIADESLCTIKDAKKLARMNACDMFNIRLSKCGGILNALEIADIARDHSIGYELGCQVGESGVLTQAGRYFASLVKDVEYYEGSYGKLLLKQDVTKQDMTVKSGGKVRLKSGPGLGIRVLDKVLDKYTVKRLRLER